MDYGMIGKIEKSKFYAAERERVQFQRFQATFDGENNGHTVEYDHGEWKCDCDFFVGRGVCSHSMAMERMLESMIPDAIPFA